MGDINRCGVDEPSARRNPDQGKNPLFNVLNALAHFDEDTNYCQGMNCVGMFVFRTMSSADNYNEVDIFYVLVYIAEELGWKQIYKKGFNKLLKVL